ncbi:MAG: flagellar hook protein [Lachnospiraceae bacterium]|nr:flagellar hook protein [Lachnospiraceae bacterium]
MTAGDSVTFNGNTYTLTDKIAAADINWATGDTVSIGAETYTVAATTNAAADQYTVVDLQKIIDTALADGKQVSSNQFHTNVTDKTSATAANAAVTTSTIIVASLSKGEISSAQLKNLDAETLAKAGANTGGTTGAVLSTGDSVTINGETTKATEAAPSAAKDVYDAIDALAVGGTVTIGSGLEQKVYTIVDEADVDEEAFKLTKDAILSKIHDGDRVSTDGTNFNTVIGDIALPESNEKVISAKKAYDMIADELQKASSIGTDVAATVSNDGNGKYTITQGTVEAKEALSFNLHVGSDADMTNKITIDIEAMDAAGLGVKGLSISDDSGNAATYAIDAIADAISKVSAQRSALGAVQNRLEHTIANLDNIVENTTAAESRIRDTDMAEMMVEYSKNNILAQAGQSMLAQANQATQGVLSLLQ